MKLKPIIKLLTVPLAYLAILLVYILLWRILGLPTQDELVNTVKGFFDQYGLWVVLISSLIEGILLAGNYFPGGVVIFLGVITAGNNILRVLAVVSIVSLSFFISYTFNYLLGRYGWYRLFVRFGLGQQLLRAQQRLSKKEFTAIMLSYWQPNLAAVTSTAAGVLKLPLKRFLLHSFIGVVLWNTFWGSVVYLLGEKALGVIVTFKYALIILLAWIGIVLVKYFLKQKRQAKREPETIQNAKDPPENT